MNADQDFIKSVEKIADGIWQKYGPAAYASSDAYNELKQNVRYSSWIVSPTHCKLVLQYTRAWSVSPEQKLSDTDQAIHGMTEIVWKKIQKIVSDNEVSYFCVYFPDQDRHLTYEDIFLDDRPPKVPMVKGMVEGLSNAVRFMDNIGAEEAAEDFCKAYIVAGIKLPTISIVAFNSSDKAIPCAKAFKPEALMKRGCGFPYSKDKIPNWCRMEAVAHEVAGGCWGISGGEVERKGRDHCLGCELNDRTEK